MFVYMYGRCVHIYVWVHVVAKFHLCVSSSVILSFEPEPQDLEPGTHQVGWTGLQAGFWVPTTTDDCAGAGTQAQILILVTGILQRSHIPLHT